KRASHVEISGADIGATANHSDACTIASPSPGVQNPPTLYVSSLLDHLSRRAHQSPIRATRPHSHSNKHDNESWLAHFFGIGMVDRLLFNLARCHVHLGERDRLSSRFQGI